MTLLRMPIMIMVFGSARDGILCWCIREWLHASPHCTSTLEPISTSLVSARAREVDVIPPKSEQNCYPSKKNACSRSTRLPFRRLSCYNNTRSAIFKQAAGDRML